jgi:hypothetical protein
VESVTVNTHLLQITRELQLPAPLTTSPASLTHTRAMGTLVVSVATRLDPASLTHTRAMGSPALSSTTALSPASITHTRAMGAPHINVKLSPASLVRTRELGDLELLVGGGAAPSAATKSTPQSFLSIAF